eukprot:Skav230001  [mRNA]  locus=scaffold17:143988:149311:- [translate_table: standard]
MEAVRALQQQLMEVTTAGEPAARLKSLFKSVVRGFFFTVETGDVSPSALMTFISAEVVQAAPKIHLRISPGNALHHRIPNFQAFADAMETCGGMGFLGQGLEAANMTVCAFNELRAPFCQLKTTTGSTHVVEGDIGTPKVWIDMHHIHDTPAMLTAGFSCQPWSLLGDQAGNRDDRASVLPQILKAAHYMQAHSVLLECVKGAGADPWVQRTIADFCAATGFKQSQVVLHLHHLFPAQRDRWWCLLVAPIFDHVPLVDLPASIQAPVVGDLFPFFPEWPADQDKQLRLDTYETRQFLQYGGLYPNIINLAAPMKTALHGWGNQLTSCPCSCRDYPLTHARLEAKGLYGALVTVGGELIVSQERVPCTRHVHPAELATCHGINPDQLWMPNLKLSLAGLGQMASPIQSCWIASHFMEAVASVTGDCVPTPEFNVWKQAQRVFQDMARIFPELVQQSSVRAFVGRLQDKVQTSQTSRYPSMHPLPSCPGFEAPEVAQPPVYAAQGGTHANTPPPLQDRGAPAEHTRNGCPRAPAERSQNGSPRVEPPPMTEESAGTEPATTDAAIVTTAETDHVAEVPQRTSGAPSPKRRKVTECPLIGGGIPAFATATDHGSHADDSTTASVPEETLTPPFTQAVVDHFARADAEVSPEQADVSADAEAPPTRIESPTMESPEPSEAHDVNATTHCIQVFVPESLNPLDIQIDKHATIGTILVAEHRIQSGSPGPEAHKPTDAVGMLLPIGDPTTPMQQVFLRPVAAQEDEDPDGIPARLRSDQVVTRVQLLHMQQQWVAHDEFAYYLRMIETTGKTSITPICVLPDGVDDDEIEKALQRWMNMAMYQAIQCLTSITALLVRGHWFPVVLRQHALGVHLTTTPEGKSWLEVAVRRASTDVVIHTEPLPINFHADCGFQSIGWLVTRILDDTEHVAPTSPMQAHNAVTWRTLFEHHLYAQDIAQVLGAPSEYAFGGMGGFDLADSLRALLQEHGVPSDVVQEQTDQVLQSVGRGQLVNALRGSQPWRDLKSLANQATPRLQLVLAAEMSDMITSKAPNRQFGQRKKKGPRQSNQPAIQITPADVEIPEGIFRDEHGNLLTQIKPEAIHANATGVVLALTTTAIPYIKAGATTKVSSKPLAMIVLDASDFMLHGVGESIRLPARCVHTQEPVLIAGKIVQLGQGVVQRHTPATPLKVEEVPNCVIRAIMYRDECEIEWTTFISQPVKEIIACLPALAEKDGQRCLLDCWDRQFLTHQMQRTKPVEADQFVVTFRVATEDIPTILAQSGAHGLYLEPREADGRKPSSAYRVVWLGKASKDDAKVSLHSTKVWSSLVRTGRRYGVRTTTQDAPAVHAQFKDTPYLDTTEAVLYIAGPFPWGATRNTLLKLFKQWQWDARPVQPRGRSVDGKGTLWEIQATKAPQFTVFTLEHADILITPVPSKQRTPVSASSAVQGSARTIAALQQQSQAVVDPTVDTLQINDPWKPKSAKTTVDPRVPSMTMMAQVDQRIQQQVQAQLEQFKKDHDVDMDASASSQTRITELEQRVVHMEQNLTAHTQSQVAHNQEVASQIQQLHSRVDAQATSLQSHIDGRLDHQLTQIERMLQEFKKSRTE